MGWAKGTFVVEKFTMAEVFMYGASVASYPHIGWWSAAMLIVGWIACNVIGHWVDRSKAKGE